MGGRLRRVRDCAPWAGGRGRALVELQAWLLVARLDLRA